MAFELATAPPHLQIDHPLNVPDPRDDTREFQTRVVRIASRILAGEAIFIQTATLRGPFDGSWSNPWNRHSSSLGRQGNNSRPNRNTAQSKKVQSSHKSNSKAFPTPTSPEADRYRGSLSTRGDRNPRSSQSPYDGKRKEKGMQGHRSSLQSLAIKSRLSKKKCDASKDKNYMNSQGTLLHKSQEPVSPDRSRAGPIVTDNHRPATETALIVEGVQEEKVQCRRICTECGTEKSHQWRKGPQGPASLCARYAYTSMADRTHEYIADRLINSCGAKWTHQQRKTITQRNAPLDSDAASKSLPRVSASKTDKVCLIRDSHGSRASRLGHSQVCRKMFPNARIESAVVNNNGLELERVISGEVLSLRGEISHLMRAWDCNGSQIVVKPEEADEILKPRAEISPCKNHIKTHISPAKVSELVHRPRNAKRRKITTFDTPLHHRTYAGAAAEVARDDHTATGSPDNGDGVEPKFPIEEKVTTELMGSINSWKPTQPSTPVSSHGERGEIVRLSNESPQVASEKQFSTQVALQEAQEAFHGHLLLPQTGDLISPIKPYLFTPRKTESILTSPRSGKHGSAVGLANTQDILDETLQFGSESPLKQNLLTSAGDEVATVIKETHDPVSMQQPMNTLSSDLAIDLQVPHDTGIANIEHSNTATSNLSGQSQQTLQGHAGRDAPPFSQDKQLTARVSDDCPSESDTLPAVDVDQIMEEAGSFLNVWAS